MRTPYALKLSLKSDGWGEQLNGTPKLKSTSINVVLDATDENLVTFGQAYASLWGEAHSLVDIVRVDSSSII